VRFLLSGRVVFVGVFSQEFFGVVDGVGSWLTAIQLGWGIHSMRPSARFRVPKTAVYGAQATTAFGPK
jgi:predicted benzoate:H+ symporter BenE